MQSEVKRRIAEGRAVMMQKVEEQLEQVSEGASQMDDKKKRMPMANQRPQASFCLFFFLKKKLNLKMNRKSNRRSPRSRLSKNSSVKNKRTSSVSWKRTSANWRRLRRKRRRNSRDPTRSV